VEKQTGSERVCKLNQLRTNFEPALVLNQVFFGGKGVTEENQTESSRVGTV